MNEIMKTPETPAVLSENFVKSLKNSFPQSGGKFARSTGQYSRAGFKFLEQAAKFTSAVKDVQEKNANDPTQTDDASRVFSANYSNKKLDELKHLHDKIENPAIYGAEIKRKIRLEKRENARSRFAKEARDRLSAMDASERYKVVSRAIREGDRETAESILGAPSGFHSGLEESQYQKLNQQFDNKFYSEDVETANKLTQLGEHFDKAYRSFSRLNQQMSAGLDGIRHKANAAKKAMKR